jgi:hypothetical protein
MAIDTSGSRPHIPRAADDTSAAVIAARQQFVQEQTGATLDHVTRYSFADRSEPFQLKITQPPGTPGSVAERATVTVMTRP